MKFSAKSLVTLGLFSALIMSATAASALSEDEVKSLMKKSNCFKCHAENKAKDGPSYKDIAEKARTKPEFAAKLYKHVTTYEKVEIKGKQEDHEPLKTKDEAEIQAILQWIQSR